MSYNKVSFFIFTSVLFFMFGCSKSCSKTAAITTNTADSKQVINNKSLSKEMESIMQEYSLNSGDKLLATIKTNMGDMNIELFWEKAPITVKNFVDLATGKKEWTHPGTQEKSQKPLYNNTIFHRVIDGFMIQGGDPMGSGFGGPGYRFKDEFHPDLKHDKKGILSMANSGPNSNGSQFFITQVATPHLNNRHTVFGQAYDDNTLKIIDTIAKTKTDARDKPLQDVLVKEITIQKL